MKRLTVLPGAAGAPLSAVFPRWSAAPDHSHNGGPFS